MTSVPTEKRAWRDLARLWSDLEEALAFKPDLQRRLQTQVIKPLRDSGCLADPEHSSVEEGSTQHLLTGWLKLSKTVAAWREFEQSLAATPRSTATAGKWNRLREDRAETLGRINLYLDDLQRRRWSFFTGRADQELLQQVRDLLENYHEAFDHLAQRVEELEPNGPCWSRIDELREECRNTLDSEANSPESVLLELPSAWRDLLHDGCELETATMNLRQQPAIQARLALLLHVVRPASRADVEWLSVWAKRLFAPCELEVELLSDCFTQSGSDWWDLSVEADLDRPTLDRLGLLVRQGDDVYCPRKGRFRLPFSPSTTYWLGLPRLPDSPASSPLHDWLDRVRQLLDQPREAAVEERQYAEQFAAWLGSEPGATWFDQLAQSAFRRDSESARSCRLWLDALLQRGWCSCHPRLDDEGAFWPADAPPIPPEVTWDWSDSVPFGRVTLVERFAADPDLARCIVSLGRSDERPGLRALNRLRELVSRSTWLRDRFGEAVARIWTASLGQELGAGSSLSPSDLLSLVKPLESVVLLASEERRQDLSRWLSAVRAWYRTEEVMLWPESDDLSRDELIAVQCGNHLRRRFDSTPLGTPLELRFGLRRGDETLSEGWLEVSAGPSPVGYRELCALLRQHQPATDRLIAKLQTWPRLLEGEPDLPRLQQVSRDLFTAFYAETDPAWRESEVGGEVEVRLADLLHSMAGLVVSQPQRHAPCDNNWKCFNERGEEVSPSSLSRVEAVLMPGLELPTGEPYLMPKVIVREVGP